MKILKIVQNENGTFKFECEIGSEVHNHIFDVGFHVLMGLGAIAFEDQKNQAASRSISDLEKELANESAEDALTELAKLKPEDIN